MRTNLWFRFGIVLLAILLGIHAFLVQNDPLFRYEIIAGSVLIFISVGIKYVPYWKEGRPPLDE